MPATKKKKTVAKSAMVIEKKVEKVSEQLNMLLIVFSIAMMAFALVLYTTYAK